MSAVGMTAKNVTVRSLTRCSPRSSSSRPPSRASGAATPTGPGTTFRLLGVPVRVSTQVPGTLAGGELILADMNQVALGRDTAPSLGVHRTLAHSDQLYLRVVARYDIKPLNAAGIYSITTA
jgi:HK97 family phage major capsid protein